MKPFNHLEGELRSLAELTLAGLKPLSRWERRFNGAVVRALEAGGLHTRVVQRRVRDGRRIQELLFSPASVCLDLYARRFTGTAVRADPATRRLEGRLFGYPSCCVESYVAGGYRRNSLPARDQEILFHWACPQCVITPLLLPAYRRIHDRFGAGMLTRRPRVRREPNRLNQRLVASRIRSVVSVLAATGTLAVGEIPPPDPHFQLKPPSEDRDGDFLTDAEELLLDQDGAHPDEDGNGVADGIDLAWALSQALDALPEQRMETEPFVVHHPTFGLGQCAVCGEAVNMGFLEVVHPMANGFVTLPYIARHFLEHGNLSYAGNEHSGRVDAAGLRALLQHNARVHFIPEPAGTDADQDGLRDHEETIFHTLPNDPDTDGNLNQDGHDLARTFLFRLKALPHVMRPEDGPADRPFIVEHPMDGYETCPQCGQNVVMDVWDVIQPRNGAVIRLSSMAVHYLTHGGFRWAGGQLLGGAGRVDPVHLEAVLSGEGDGHQLIVPHDGDGDLLTDDEESRLGSDQVLPDEDGNGVADGIDLAKSLAAQIEALPLKPQPDGVYREDHLLRGLELCAICGETVNMGHLTVGNPVAAVYARVPYIALHYLAHGSFSFEGDAHGLDRTDVKLLRDVLAASHGSHARLHDDDTDGDGLRDGEETRFGFSANAWDSDHDGVPDGFSLARKMWERLNQLPRTPAAAIHAVDHAMRGVVTCKVCGATINMGYLEVVNRAEAAGLIVPYLALHALEWGSFDFGETGRLNPRQLEIALAGDGSSHLIAMSEDADQDGLLASEEAAFGTLPAIADSDADGVLDGVEWARQLHARVTRLSADPALGTTHVCHHEAKCNAPCPVCGEEINCGFLEVINPWAGLSLGVPYLNLHFLAHGGFLPPEGVRTDPLLLDAILEPGVVIAIHDQQVSLRWKGLPGRTYHTFTAEEITGPWTPGPGFLGDGTDLILEPPREQASGRQFFKITSSE